MKTDLIEPAASDSAATFNGSAWAALLSAGVGCATFGLLTDLSECSPRVSGALNWYVPAGSLSGVAAGAVIIWLLAWAVLALRWKHRRLTNEAIPMAATLVLVLAGIVATFPPFYELFAKGK